MIVTSHGKLNLRFYLKEGCEHKHLLELSFEKNDSCAEVIVVDTEGGRHSLGKGMLTITQPYLEDKTNGK